MNNVIEIKSDHESGESKYNTFFNNCVDACQDAIGDEVDLPVDYSPVPKDYFDKLKAR